MKTTQTKIRIAWNKGKKLSDGHIKNLSKSHLGQKAWNKGIPMAKAQKEKLSKRNILLNIKPPSRLGIKLTPKQRLKKAKTHKKGELHWNWKGGINSINDTIRKSIEYRLWRESVFERDNWTCIWCGEKGYVEADHIKPFALFPELRFAIDNGRTLCIDCHKKTDTYGGRTIYKKVCLAVA